MLDYEWGNPSMILLSGDETVQQSDENRHHIYPNYDSQCFNEATSFVGNNPNAHFTTTADHHHHHHDFLNPHTHLSSLYDPPAYGGSSASYVSQASLLSLEPAGPSVFMAVPKDEPVVGGVTTSHTSRIGLNLGGRTYFSSAEDDFVNRMYHRSRVAEPGLVNSPRCQVEGCIADLTYAKHYHRRHKVCEFHSKAATVITARLTQRFCQQCSRFHLLSEFDNGKRSCRKRLADHNRRRRKSQQAANQQLANKSHLARSPSDSGAHSSSVTASVSVSISPPRISLDSFRQRSYQTTTHFSTSTSPLYFSEG